MVLRVLVRGPNSGQRVPSTYDLVNPYDAVTQTSSMAHTTAYTATMAVRLVANRMYSRKGISAPEHMGRQPECVEFLLDGLRDRGVVYEQAIEEFELVLQLDPYHPQAGKFLAELRGN